MSRENVETVRHGYDAYNAGDMATLFELYDPAVVMYHLEGWPEPGPSVGRDAVLREAKQLREAWPDGDRSEPIGELIESGNHVLARDVWHASGSGPEAVMEFTTIYTFREGKVITVQRYWDHSKALEAVGLSAS